MQYSFLTLGLLCLAEQAPLASAKYHVRSPLADANLAGHGAYINAQVRKRADVTLNHAEYVRRSAYAAPDPIAAVASASSSESRFTDLQVSVLTPTNNGTEAACTTALTLLKGKPSNPSGMSVCYNIATFNNKTGDFQAHVLIYQIGPATGKWTSLKNGTDSIGLQYPGATVQSQTMTNTTKRDLRDSEAAQLTTRTTATAPEMMKDLIFVGKIDKTMMNMLTNITAMHSSLTPIITLSAKTSTNENLNLVISNTEAAFVNGFFSAAQLKAELKALPFVLPGTTLGIFPTGLIITGAWALLFILAVGFGTVGRIRFRSAYRRRTAGGQYGDSAVGPSATSGTTNAAYDKPAKI